MNETGDELQKLYTCTWKSHLRHSLLCMVALNLPARTWCGRQEGQSMQRPTREGV